MNGRMGGTAGENAAEAYLIEKGAEILKRNYRAAGGEIDIIARFEGRIVFVEVKARYSLQHGSAGEAITPAKAARIRRAAMVYLKQSGGLAQRSRFDAILLSPDGIKHVPGAF